MLRFDRAYSPQKEVREKCIEATRFARVPGGQWEGATAAGTKLDEQLEKYPKFEINKVATELNRIIAEYRNNRITVKFRPGDREASEELANKLNGLFRADYEETDGGEACDNAFDDAATGGFGCFRLTSMLVNEYDPMDDRQRIAIEPIYDPSRSVWFEAHKQRAAKLPVKDYQEMEAIVLSELPPIQQEIIIHCADEGSELLAYGLGKSQQLRQRVAAETDPIRAAFLLGQISKQVSLAPKPKKAIKPEPEVRGGGADAKQDEFNKLCPGAKIE